MEAEHSILMVGTCLRERGGISSVFNIYNDYGFLKGKYYLASHRKGPIVQRIYMFIICVLKFFGYMLFKPQIKIVHVHVSQRGSFFRKSIIVLFAKLFLKRVILHMHGSEFELFYRRSPKIVKDFIRAVLSCCDTIIVLSESWKSILSTITDNRNIQVVYNPAIVAKKAKKYETLASQRPNFIFLGNIGQRKGVYDIVEAVRQLERPEFTISIFGDGEVEKVRKLVNELNINEIVKIHGWVSGVEKKSVLDQSHALLLPSYNEGLPISILEALSVGMPILTTTVGGIPEAVEDGRNGFLIKPGDVEMLKHKLIEMSSSPELLRRMSASAYMTAKEKFDYKVIFSRLNEIYLNTISK